MTSGRFRFVRRTSLDPDTAFDVVTDFTGHDGVPFTWIEVDDPRVGVGHRFTAVTRVGPLELRDLMEVVDHVRPGPGVVGRCRIVKLGSPLGGEALIEVVAAAPPAGGGSTGSLVRWTETVRVGPPVLAALAAPFVTAAGPLLFGRVLQGQLRRAEGDAGSAGR